MNKKMKKNVFAQVLIVVVFTILAGVLFLSFLLLKNKCYLFGFTSCFSRFTNTISTTPLISQQSQKELIEYVRSELTADCLKIVNDPSYLKSCDNLVPASIPNCKKQVDEDRSNPESACDHSTYEITIESIEGNYALGNGPTFYWAAAKTNEQWTYAMTGNAAPECIEVEIFPIGTFNGKFDSCFKEGELVERK